jgi:DNA-binding NtrC family response regulator
VERQRIVEALERFRGNQVHTARHLGISRRTLQLRMKQFDLPRPGRGKRA